MNPVFAAALGQSSTLAILAIVAFALLSRAWAADPVVAAPPATPKPPAATPTSIEDLVRTGFDRVNGEMDAMRKRMLLAEQFLSHGQRLTSARLSLSQMFFGPQENESQRIERRCYSFFFASQFFSYSQRLAGCGFSLLKFVLPQKRLREFVK